MPDYKVNFINQSYRRFFQQHKAEIMDAFERCATNGDFMLREETRQFERKLAEYIGVDYAVGLNSCTDAMFLSLKALGIGKGDEVITTAHTFIATLQAIVHTGAKPVLVDVGSDELMNTDELIKAFTDNTRAIIPVHFHGKVCDMKTLMDLNIPIIEDAAQALGAKQDGKMAGSFGITGCFSFNFPKLLGAYGDAGAVVTNNEDIYKRLLLLRNHWNITQGSVRQEDYPQPEEMGWGWKSRIDNVQAAILLVKFKYLDEMLARRMEIHNRYNQAFRVMPLNVPHHRPDEVVQEYVIRVEDNVDFKNFMDAEGIEVLVRDIAPNHKLKGLGLDHYSLPVTERLARECVRLPCYPEMTDGEIEQVINAVKKYYAQR